MERVTVRGSTRGCLKLEPNWILGYPIKSYQGQNTLAYSKSLYEDKIMYQYLVEGPTKYWCTQMCSTLAGSYLDMPRTLQLTSSSISDHENRFKILSGGTKMQLLRKCKTFHETLQLTSGSLGFLMAKMLTSSEVNQFLPHFT